MDDLRSKLFGGVFMPAPIDGHRRLMPHPAPPGSLVDPRTGRSLRIATVEVARAICPACERQSVAGFVSFAADLRMVFACPACEEMVWVMGA